jgi:death on curing protein
LIKNHPFQNGNKRIAVTALLVFLYLNKKWFKADETELYNFARFVAQSLPEMKDQMIIAIENFIKKRLIDIK